MVDRMINVYRHDPEIVSRQVAGEMILVPIRKSMGDMESIYTLNETAARIWELIDGQRSLAEIQAVMVAEFDVEPAEAGQDLDELVDSLVAQGALIAVAE